LTVVDFISVPGKLRQKTDSFLDHARMKGDTMRTARIPIVLAALLFLSLSALGADTELWIVSGQSNATGQGKLPGPDPDPAVEMYDEAAGAWVPAKDPLALDRLKMKGGKKQSCGVGPWQTAALAVAKGTGKKVRITGSSNNGRAISFWDEGADGWKCLSEIIDKAGKNADVFLWYQGESDGLKSVTEEKYLEKLTDLVKRIRARAGNPKMTAVIVQIGALAPKKPMSPIREAQRLYAEKDDNAILVTALGRPLRDPYHLKKASYIELGQEIGRALLRTRAKKTDVNWPGPIMKSAVLQKDGVTVKVVFSEAKELSGCSAKDFCVLASGKPLPCAKADAKGPAVTLTFASPVSLPAKLAYGYGNAPRARLADEAGNRAPAVQMEITR
jgi:hypothetical protein